MVTMRAIKNIRLKTYDYSSDGYYFVTIDTNYRMLYLQGNIKNIVVAELARLNTLEGVKIDYYVVMSSHIHLIIILEKSKYSLSEIIRRFKSKTTVFVRKYANQDWQSKSAQQAGQLQKLWQPGYYEHIIRNDNALTKIREYITNNPNVEKVKFGEFYG